MIWYGIYVLYGNVQQRVRRDPGKTLKLCKEAHSSGKMSNFYKCLFASILFYERQHRDLEYCQQILQEILNDDPNDPYASFQLAHALFLDRVDDGSVEVKIKQLINNAERSIYYDRHKPEKYGGRFIKLNMIEFIRHADNNYHIPSVLLTSEGKPRQCLLLLVGCPESGKTSTLRSLIGEKFKPDLNRTRLINLKLTKIIPGESVHQEDNKSVVGDFFIVLKVLGLW